MNIIILRRHGGGGAAEAGGEIKSSHTEIIEIKHDVVIFHPHLTLSDDKDLWVADRLRVVILFLKDYPSNDDIPILDSPRLVGGAQNREINFGVIVLLNNSPFANKSSESNEQTICCNTEANNNPFSCSNIVRCTLLKLHINRMAIN